MRLLRPLVAVATAAAVASAGSALAAPEPVCELIEDATGDTTGPSTALDIVSADLASKGKTVTAVIRTAALSETDLSSPTGIAWELRFTSPRSELPYYLLASAFQGSEVQFSYGEVDGTSLVELGVARGVVDLTKKEVRIHAPAKAVGLRPGLELEQLIASGRRAFGTNGLALYSSADSATTDETYTVDAPSCVTPGK